MICFSAKLEKLTSRFKLIDVAELDDIHQQIEEVKEHLRAKSKIWNYIVLSNMLEKASVLQHKPQRNGHLQSPGLQPILCGVVSNVWFGDLQT